jgi:cyclopropane-fatty-acyl-phospholipid synthase
MSLIDLCERGLIPDFVTRMGVRRLCAKRLKDEHAGDAEAAYNFFRDRLANLRRSPIAIHTDAANEQHYEVPPGFFQLCLGERLKYSSCYFPPGVTSLDEAEEHMLELYGQRAQLVDGQDVLELGCGWGSLTLWMAQKYPRSKILAVSNSAPQREFIQGRCKDLGLRNVGVLTQDVNKLTLDRRFDRVVSIEMFEHMRNYDQLLAKIASWLEPGGKLFVHIFCHRELMYPFETDGDDNWMGRHFFTGGIMPAADTLLWFQNDLRIEEQWRVSGVHYQKTANAWLANQDRRKEAVMAVLRQAYGPEHAKLWFQRWRMFWMACAELFGYRGGNEWLVGHYRFVKP